MLDRLTGAVEELETTDTQRFRQILASIKEIKDIQMLDSPDERLEKQIKLKNLERQMLEAEAENVSGFRRNSCPYRRQTRDTVNEIRARIHAWIHALAWMRTCTRARN